MKFWEKSLMARLVGYFLILSLVTVGLVGYIAFIRAREALKQSLFDRLEAVATLKEDELTRWIDDQRQNVVFIAWSPEVRRLATTFFSPEISETEYQSAYTLLSEQLGFVANTMTSDLQEVFIFDAQDGKILISTEKKHEGESRANEPYFAQGRSGTYVQHFALSPLTDKPTMVIATPLFDTDGKQVAVLAVEFNLAKIDRIILERAGLGTSGETYLVNTSNVFVSAEALFSGQDFSGGVHSEGIDTSLQGTNGSGLYLNYVGVPVVGVYHWLDEREVALLAELSQAEAFAPARQLAWTIFLIGSILAGLLAAGVYFLARQIARPILAITDTATQVADGDLTQIAPVLTKDEVGVLARAFNQMTGQLRLLYESLEEQVKERTSALTQANRFLQQEIVERTRAEEALRQQNEYLAALHDTTLGLITRLDLNELLQALVSRAGQLLGAPYGFVYLAEPGAEALELKVVVGLSAQQIGERMELGEGLAGRVWQSGQPLVVDDYDAWPGRIPDISYGVVRAIIGVPLTHSTSTKQSGPQVGGVIGLAFDTESGQTFGDEEVELLSRFAQLAVIALDNARLYASAQQAREVAEAANQAKSDFLASVSHELRTPLTSVLGFAKISQRSLETRLLPKIQADDPRTKRDIRHVRENIDIIVTEGERLTNLINDVLDLAKIEAGRVEWSMQPLAIAEVIERAVAATASLVEQKDLALIKDITTDLPEVIGDQDQLIQVVINLISNAVKFTEQGSITCRARQVNREVVVSVIDTGPGIAEADQLKVFEKFKQVGDTLTGKPEGTGLGLPICKEIVERHGGRIWVESEPGQGSTFLFTLPSQGIKAAF